MGYLNTRLLGSLCVAALLVLPLLILVGCQESVGPNRVGDEGAISSTAKGDYSMIRAQRNLVRTESRTGRTWMAPLNGDGGWRSVGGPVPDTGGRNGYPGRYRVSFVPPIKGGMMDTRPSYPTGLLLRLDEATGRTWVMDLGGETDWLMFEGDDPSPLEAESVDEEAAETPPLTPPAAATSPANRPSLADLASPADQPSVDLASGTMAENLKAFSDAINKPHLPTEIRVWAVEQLGRYPADEAGPLLLPALDDKDPAVVIAAIQSANRLGFAPAIPRIVRLQSHTNAEIRAEANRTVRESS